MRPQLRPNVLLLAAIAAIAPASGAAARKPVQVAPPTELEALRGVPCADLVRPDGTPVHTCMMEASVYQERWVRLELDVQAGPASSRNGPDGHVSEWTLEDPTNARWLEGRGLLRVVVTRSGDQIRIDFDRHRETQPVTLASADR